MASPAIGRIESWMRCPVAIKKCESKNTEGSSEILNVVLNGQQ